MGWMLYHTALLAMGLTLGASQVSAQVQLDVLTAELLPGWRAADGTHIAALRLTLAPGWKTFWRAPGDAGIPPRFDTDRSDNLAEMTPVWPRPDVFDVSGMRSVGYTRELVLPLRVTPENTENDISLRADINLGVCSDICVPANFYVEGSLPVAGQSDARIVAALVDVPYSAEEAGVQSVACYTAPLQYGTGFRAEIVMPQMPGREQVVLEASDPSVWVAEARAWWEGETLIAETEISHSEDRGYRVDMADVRLTVIGRGQAVDIQGCAIP
ncbi:MAG: hypothetical protein MK098_11185 [Marinovum sp.]|nr:hypothetical protein [Marinovum sp.]